MLYVYIYIYIYNYVTGAGGGCPVPSVRCLLANFKFFLKFKVSYLNYLTHRCRTAHF